MSGRRIQQGNWNVVQMDERKFSNSFCLMICVGHFFDNHINKIIKITNPKILELTYNINLYRVYLPTLSDSCSGIEIIFQFIWKYYFLSLLLFLIIVYLILQKPYRMGFIFFHYA